MRLTFYGGVGEIGGNKVLLSSGDTRIFLDFGMSFKKRGDFYEDFLQPRTNNVLRDLLRLGILPAIDGIYRDDLLRLIELPDDVPEGVGRLLKAEVQSYQEILDKTGAAAVHGVVITHGHVDHYQDLVLIDPHIPVYAGAVTHRIIKIAEEIGRGGIDQELSTVKMKSVGRQKGGFFPGAWNLTSDPVQRRMEVITESFEFPGLKVTRLPVDHSVPGASAFYVESDSGVSLLYTGDIRFHGRRPEYNEELLTFVDQHRVDILLVEGTRIDQDDADSEALMEEECLKVTSQAEGLVLIAFAWKDTTRFETLRRVAAASGRQLVVSPKMAYLINAFKDTPEVTFGNGLADPVVKVYVKRKTTMLYSLADYVTSKYDIGLDASWDPKDPNSVHTEHFTSGVRAYDIRSNPRQFILHLDYYDLNELIDLEPPKGSILIRAISEPFNEEMRLEEERLNRWLERFNINEHTRPPHRPIYVHASGHASGPEICDFIKRVNPRFVVPLHTEHPEAFARILHTPSIEIRQPTYGVPLELV